MLPKKFNEYLDSIRFSDGRGIIEIYNYYYKRMELSAYQKVHDFEAAKDIASDIIKYILERAKDIAYIENPNAWIFKLVSNKSIDYIRKERKYIGIDYINEERLSSVPDYSFFVEFTSAINKLEETDKEIVNLHYIQGYRYKEISIMLDIPIGTIKRKIYEIKQKNSYLKKYL